MLMLPLATRLPALAPESSVTDRAEATVGTPMTGASLLPCTVKLITWVAPSAAVTVKLSTLLWPTPRLCVALLATV